MCPHKFVESLLELKPVVGLDEIALERKSRYAQFHGFDREALIEEWEDDSLFVPGIYIHDRVQKERVGEP